MPAHSRKHCGLHRKSGLEKAVSALAALGHGQYGESCLQQAGTPMGIVALAVSIHLNWELSLPSDSVQPLPVSPGITVASILQPLERRYLAPADLKGYKWKA